MGGCLVSGPFSESELREKYPQVLLNSSGAEIKDLAKPDVRTLVDETQRGGDQDIRLTMQPARRSLADALRITDRLGNRPPRNGAASLPTAAA